MGLSSAYAGVRWWAAIALLVARCFSKGLITAKGFVHCDGEPVAWLVEARGR